MMGTGNYFPGGEANHSAPTSAEVTNGGAIPPLPHVCMVWYLIKHRDNFANMKGARIDAVARTSAELVIWSSNYVW
jgi:hypothetical protein